MKGGTRRSSAFGLVVALVLLAALTAPAAAQAEASSADAVQTAERALRRGDELQGQGRHREAIEVWRAGLQAMPHWILLLRIANAYRQLGRCDLALPYMRMGWTWRDESFTEEMRPRLEDAMNVCQRALPSRLDVSTSRGGVTLFVDGQRVGVTPLEAFEVTPGLHRLRGSREGFEDTNVVVQTVPGETAYVELTLSPLSGVGEVPGGATEAEALQLGIRRQRGRRWGGLLLGLGLALGGGGATLTALEGYELENRRGISSLGPGVALLGLGVALIAGGITLLALPPPAADESP